MTKYSRIRLWLVTVLAAAMLAFSGASSGLNAQVEVPPVATESEAAEVEALLDAVPLVQPTTLRVSAFRDEVESRRLLLRVPLGSGARFYAQDLIDGDGDDVFPAASLALTLSHTSTATVEGIPVLLPADLRIQIGDTPSGRYVGETLLVGGGREAAVALEVSVKDRPGWPLFTLLAGVAAGMAITWYRQQLGPRDRLLVAVDDLLREAERDELLHEEGRAADFRRRLTLHTGDAGAAIRSQAWDSAQGHLALAQRTLDLWRRERDGWLVALSRRDKLAKAIGNDESAYLADLRAALGKALPALLEQATTGDLKTSAQAFAPSYDEALREIDDWLSRHATFASQVAKAREILAGVAGAEGDALRVALRESEAAMAALRPASLAADAERATMLAAGLRELTAAAEKLAAGGTEELARPHEESREQEESHAAESWVPLDAKVSDANQVRQARLRTWVAWGLGFVVAAALLGGAGFQELYVSNPIFGARRWFDYFTLLAWGLGAEATSASIAGLLRNWDLPVVDRKGTTPSG